jgi:hypothetical protein
LCPCRHARDERRDGRTVAGAITAQSFPMIYQEIATDNKMQGRRREDAEGTATPMNRAIIRPKSPSSSMTDPRPRSCWVASRTELLTRSVRFFLWCGLRAWLATQRVKQTNLSGRDLSVVNCTSVCIGFFAWPRVRDVPSRATAGARSAAAACHARALRQPGAGKVPVPPLSEPPGGRARASAVRARAPILASFSATGRRPCTPKHSTIKTAR